MTLEAHRFAYLQVAADLRREIADKALLPGQRLPSIRELSAQFAVSAQTVQKALAQLSDDGLIRAGSTKGYFIADSASSAQTPSDVPSRIAALENHVRELAERVALLERGEHPSPQ